MSQAQTRLLFALLVLPVSVALASLLLCASASAQCSPILQQFQNIALVSSSPFVAEYATTGTSTMVAQASTTSHGGLKSVARDSEGRVRVERSAGKYNVKTPEGAPSEVERESRLRRLSCSIPRTRPQRFPPGTEGFAGSPNLPRNRAELSARDYSPCGNVHRGIK